MAEEWNRDKLEVWLEPQPPEVRIVIAHRVSLRVAPVLLKDVLKDFGGEWQAKLTLQSIRCYLLSALGGYWASDNNIISAAASARLDASYAADSTADRGAASAVRSAVISVETPSIFPDSAILSADWSAGSHDSADSAAALWRSVGVDIEFLESGNTARDLLTSTLDLDGSYLWNDYVFALIDQLEQQDGFGFWAKFLRDRYFGNLQNWEMLREIGLLPDEDWEQGAEHIAEKIEEIEAKYREEAVEENIEENAEPTNAIGHNSAAYGEIMERAFSPREIRKSLERDGLAPKALNNQMMQQLQQIQAEIMLHSPDDASALNRINEIIQISVMLDQYLPEGLPNEDTPLESIGEKLKQLAEKIIDHAQHPDQLGTTTTAMTIGVIGLVVAALAPAAVLPIMTAVGGGSIIGQIKNVNFGKQKIVNKSKKKAKTGKKKISD